MKKRILTLSLALILLLGAVVGLSSCGTTSSTLPDAEDDSGIVESLVWSYTASTKTLRLENTTDGRIPDAESAAAVAWSGVRHSVERVELVGSFTEIGNYAFYYFTKLTSITIPEGVTRIGDQAFAFCSSIGKIDIPEGVVSIGNGCFESCSAITSMEFPQTVTAIGANVLDHCKSLKVVRVLGNAATVGEYAFRGCTSLHTVAHNNAAIAENAYADANVAWVGELATPDGRVELKINYVNEDGGALVNTQPNPQVVSLRIGDEYVVAAPSVENFLVLDGDNNTVKGTYYSTGIIRDNSEITVKYRQNGVEAAAPTVTPDDTTATDTKEKSEIGAAEIIAIVIFALVIVGIVVIAIIMMRSDKKSTSKKNKSKKK